jgi:hypothetical protein
MIYIIGDSHVSVFSGTDKTFDGLRHIQPEFGTCYTLKQGKLREKINRFEQNIPYFCPIKVGSYTAYNSYKKLPIIEQAIEEYNIKPTDFVFLCFGEIDIRNHIGFHAIKNGKNLDQTIRECVDRYMNTVLYLKSKGLKIGVYAPPSSSVGLGSHADYGDVYIRNQITIDFNKYLKERCYNHNIIFKDISKQMMLSDGSTDQKYIMDDIHLSQNAMLLLVEEFFEIIDEDTGN